MNMRTPLSQVTGLGSTRDGTGHFWRQRLTGLANVFLTLFLIWFVIAVAAGDRGAVATGFANPFVAGLMILSIVSFAWHMKLGMQMVIEDYVQGEELKIALVIANIFFAVAIAVLGLVSVLQLGFGG